MMIKREITLYELAYMYLAKKQSITHEKYTIADLFDICEKILQFLERKGRYQKAKAKFIDGHLEISEWIGKY